MRPIVETRSGRVEGAVEAGRMVFRGVPFARPPLGDLRFRPPVEPEAWTGLLDAGGWRHSPPQATDGLGAVNDTSEDCLTVNVFTPATGGARLPVIVWVFGGGFYSGTGSLDLYDHALLGRRPDVVLVTFNYRVGLLGGFLDVGSVTGSEERYPANVGLLDQVAALRWVHENIAAFGGDPANVTVCGISSGSTSIAALMACPVAEGLFRRAIMQSGPPHHVHDRPEVTERLVAEMAREVDVPLGQLAETLARMSTRELSEAQAAYVRQQTAARPSYPFADSFRDDESGIVMPFAPTVDGRVLPAAPMQAIQRGAGAAVDVLTGTTRDELRVLVATDPGVAGLDFPGLVARLAVRPWARDRRVEDVIDAYRRAPRASGDPAPVDLLAAIDTDEEMRIPTLRVAESRGDAPGGTYVYLFTWEATLPSLGACHGVDLPFVLGTLTDPRMEAMARDTPDARRLATTVQDAWVAFAATGNPSGPGLAWPQYGLERRPTALLGPCCEVVDDPSATERRAWDWLR